MVHLVLLGSFGPHDSVISKDPGRYLSSWSVLSDLRSTRYKATVRSRSLPVSIETALRISAGFDKRDRFFKDGDSIYIHFSLRTHWRNAQKCGDNFIRCPTILEKTEFRVRVKQLS